LGIHAAGAQTEVRNKLNELKQQHHIGQLVEPKRLTLGDFLDQWLEAGEVDWKPKTLHGYRTIVRYYWKPELGHIQLQKLAPAMLVACYAKWRKGRSGGTLLNAHRCLHRALVVAVRWGLVARTQRVSWKRPGHNDSAPSYGLRNKPPSSWLSRRMTPGTWSGPCCWVQAVGWAKR
jgi:Phage integrase, N-terminal SAM-like domain